MFFTPTLLGLQRQGVAVHVLCLSTGNFAGLGATRARELRASCTALGVAEGHVHCLDDPQLQDGPAHVWPPARVAALVHAHCHERGVSRIITFDSGGVSGHPNHVAAYEGVRLLLAGGSSLAGWRLGKPLAAYSLHSTGALRKHLGLWEVLVSLLLTLACSLWRPSPPRPRHPAPVAPDGGPRLCCFVTMRPARAHVAMRAHGSQYVWYRKLYVLTSRYVWVNTLRAIGSRAERPPVR